MQTQPGFQVSLQTWNRWCSSEDSSHLKAVSDWVFTTPLSQASTAHATSQGFAIQASGCKTFYLGLQVRSSQLGQVSRSSSQGGSTATTETSASTCSTLLPAHAFPLSPPTLHKPMTNTTALCLQ